MSNFEIKHPTMKHRPVSSNLLIIFTNLTTVKLIPDEESIIPYYKFELVVLGDLYKLATPYDLRFIPEYATSNIIHTFIITSLFKYIMKGVCNYIYVFIDIMGVVIDLQPLMLLPSTYGDQNVVQFKITDEK